MTATACRREQLRLIAEDGLRWYQSSSAARRGFCHVCGSNLFWEPASGTHISIMAGTLDPPTGLATVFHIHVETAGDYYSISDGLPQFREGAEGLEVF